jgi:phosphoribosylglycinamide formyltransferase 1
MEKALSIGWFSTARGESSQKLLNAIVDSINKGNLNACIEFVFCSRDWGESNKTDTFLTQVNNYHIPLVNLSVQRFADKCQQKVGVTDEFLPEWRLQYDKQIIDKLQNYNPDICVMAGYMLIVGPEICNKFDIINLHPALPNGPKGTWQNVIWSLIQQQATQSGNMMHLVTTTLDRGPVITYCKFDIRGPKFDKLWKDNAQATVTKNENNELFKAIRQEGFIREIPLIISTIKAFSEHKIQIDKNKRLVDANGCLLEGYDLTEEVDNNRNVSK